METEIEAQFANVDRDELRAKLKAFGAVLLVPDRLMRRKVYEHKTGKENDWFRVRDEGGKITLSYKKLNDRTLYGTEEVVIEVDDFEKACTVLEKARLEFVSYQETRRESWQLDGVEIDIDEWPWVPPFVEIEGKSEAAVKALSQKLGFDWATALHGSVENIYQICYDVTEEEVDDWPEITFVPVPVWLEAKRKPA